MEPIFIAVVVCLVIAAFYFGRNEVAGSEAQRMGAQGATEQEVRSVRLPPTSRLFGSRPSGDKPKCRA